MILSWQVSKELRSRTAARCPCLTFQVFLTSSTLTRPLQDHHSHIQDLVARAAAAQVMGDQSIVHFMEVDMVPAYR